MKSLLFILFTAVTAFGQGTMLWNESLNGPLSFDPNNPTALGLLSAGTNSLIGATEVEPAGNGYFVHEDYFTILVPNNLAVASISITVNKPNVGVWLGDPTFSTQIAYAGSPSTGELLAQWPVNSIGPGLYGIYMANHDFQSITSIANYRLDFFVQSIPEPSTLLFLLVGLSLVVVHRRKKPRPVRNEP